MYQQYTPTHFTTRSYCGVHFPRRWRRSQCYSEDGSINSMKFLGHLHSNFVAMKYRILALHMSNCDAKGAR